jgi:hypothetical protein
VTPGYYTSGPLPDIATQETVCPVGQYCPAGVGLLCPAGASCDLIVLRWELCGCFSSPWIGCRLCVWRVDWYGGYSVRTVKSP